MDFLYSNRLYLIIFFKKKIKHCLKLFSAKFGSSLQVLMESKFDHFFSQFYVEETQ